MFCSAVYCGNQLDRLYLLLISFIVPGSYLYELIWSDLVVDIDLVQADKLQSPVSNGSNCNLVQYMASARCTVCNM